MIDRLGQQLGNYRLTRLIGQGGFGEVYLGEHVYLGTNAAIKVLAVRLANEDIAGFRNEARTIANLKHPNIVRVLDFGIDSGTPFLVMDYAPHGTLRQHYPKGTRLPLPAIVSYVKQLADALQYAHDRKLVHRDIKPENMLLGENYEMLLGDFGIALVTQSSRYQKTQEVVGTVAYMSPEQIQGKPRPASDQYALGIVVYEWLSGNRPFHGSFTELCTQHLFASPPPLSEKVPAISPEVEQVVLRVLAKDPKQRFECVRDFALALEEASQAEPPTLPYLRPATSIPPLLQTSTPSLTRAPQLQRSGPPSPNVSSAEVSPVAKELEGRGIAAKSDDEKVNMWRIERQHAIAMALGTTLYAIFIYSVNVVAPKSDILTRPIDASLFSSFAIANILYNLIRLIPLFFAARYGPWVGFCTAGVGGVLADYFSGPIEWRWPIGGALTAFIAGLAVLKTRGRYNNMSSIATAGIAAAIGVVIGVFLQVYSNIWLRHISLVDTTITYLVDALPSIIVSLLLLPLVLIAYSRAARPQERIG